MERFASRTRGELAQMHGSRVPICGGSTANRAAPGRDSNHRAARFTFENTRDIVASANQYNVSQIADFVHFYMK